jgi:hypothetical protein
MLLKVTKYLRGVNQQTEPGLSSEICPNLMKETEQHSFGANVTLVPHQMPKS